jgi:hypothetical protein
VSNHKNPIDQALDVLVFAPLGLLFSARETVPQLAEKGRQFVAAARVMGEFALGQSREQAEKAVRQASDQAGQTLSVVGGLTAGRRPRPATSERPTTPERHAPPPPPPPAPEGVPARAEAAAETSGNGRAPAASADNLAIPGYDTLSASQVVQRLGGLAADELEAVRAYEEASRKRKTILARVEQLQSGS